MNKSLYEVLGVSRDATSGEIEQAALQMGEKFRPDRNPDDFIAKRRFEEIERAFAVLRDPIARANYDLNANHSASSSRSAAASRAPGQDSGEEAGTVGNDSTVSSAPTQTCPVCRERVHIDALKCKHCGAVFPAPLGEMSIVGWISLGFGTLMLLFAYSAMEKSAAGAMSLAAVGFVFGWLGLHQRRPRTTARRPLDPELLAYEPPWRKPLHAGWLQSSRMTTLGLFLATAGLSLAGIGLLVGGERHLGSALGLSLRPFSLVVGLLIAAGASLMLRETAFLKLEMPHYAKRLGAGVGGTITGLFALALIAAVFGFDSPRPASQTAVPESPRDIQPAAPSVSTPSNSDGELNSCFLQGQSLATVYIANIVEAARADVMASEIMSEGCQRKAETVPDRSSCIRTCESGFRSRARDLLRK